jgi:C4-dicarboxylate-specific signal transduction histidine kinase
MTKKSENIWFSAIDLNIENGKIEIPFKPTLRAILPILNNDKFDGILIINYFMQDFLASFSNMPLYDSIIFNNNGYSMYHYKTEKCWGFYQKKQYNIKDEFPNEYKNILENSMLKKDEFVSVKFDTPIYNGFNLILKLKSSYLEKQKQRELERYFYVSIIIFMLSIVLVALVIRFFSRTLLNIDTISELNSELSYRNKLLEESNQKLQDSEEEILIMNDNLKEMVETKIVEIRKKDDLLLEQSKLAMMGEMIGNIAHQWRQPLNSISIVKEEMVINYFDDDLTKEEMKEFSQNIDEILLYMSNTIDDFRNFFISSKEKSDFNVLKSLSSVKNIVSAQLNSNNIELKINNNENKELYINGYQSEFNQVLINIINNAKDAVIKNSAIENGKISVDLYLDYLYQEVVIKISDNGGGIDDDILVKIFEPYFTTKFESQGTGIGLYMSKTIIEKSFAGKLDATNSKNGAVFTIRIPTK